VGAVARALFESVDVVGRRRLLGVSLSGFTDTGAGVQLSLLGDENPDRRRRPHQCGVGITDETWSDCNTPWSGVTDASTASGPDSAGVGRPASLMGRDGLRVRERGDGQWGPQASPGKGQPGRRGSAPDPRAAPGTCPGASAAPRASEPDVPVAPGDPVPDAAAAPRAPGSYTAAPMPNANEETEA